MKKYICITSDGDTIAPDGLSDVNNLQVLGIINNAIDENDAIKKLLMTNDWILEVGFSETRIQCLELL